MRIAIRAETSHLQFHLNSGLQRTHHLFDAKAIACLPHGAIVVNAARGGIVVDEDSKLPSVQFLRKSPGDLAQSRSVRPRLPLTLLAIL